jgi:hypothetical protein
MRPAAFLLSALLLAACQTAGEEEAPATAQAPDSITPESEIYVPGTSDVAIDALPPPEVAAAEAAEGTEPADAAANEAASDDAGPAQQVPHIYMALQEEGTGKPVSVVFAIDASRDNTPSDYPAIRITPDGGLCNPQEMRFYKFPERYAARPVVSEIEQDEGLKVIDLPNFMAISVTNEMMSQGLATAPEQTRPQNVCTRKLWERLILAENQPAAPAGQ